LLNKCCIIFILIISRIIYMYYVPCATPVGTIVCLKINTTELILLESWKLECLTYWCKVLTSYSIYNDLICLCLIFRRCWIVFEKEQFLFIYLWSMFFYFITYLFYLMRMFNYYYKFLFVDCLFFVIIVSPKVFMFIAYQ